MTGCCFVNLAMVSFLPFETKDMLLAGKFKEDTPFYVDFEDDEYDNINNDLSPAEGLKNDLQTYPDEVDLYGATATRQRKQ